MRKQRMARLVLAWVVLVAAVPSPAHAALAAKNVIIMIGDGMGFGHVQAGGYYAHGAPGTLSFEQFPFRGEVSTLNVTHGLTDSAAAATAMATGYKVVNAAISTAQPAPGYPWGAPLPTLLEIFKAQGKSTGLVTTTQMTHATPACFGAHANTRSQTTLIAGVYLNQTRPNVLFGGGGYGMSIGAAQAAGYTVVTDRAQMQAINPNAVTYLSGQFGLDHLPYETSGLGALPHLSEMTGTALDVLQKDVDGFFLMIEGGRIDHGAGEHSISRTVGEVVEFDHAVREVLEWMQGRDDTLLIVTADHETGGLIVQSGQGQGVMPSVIWTAGDHTTAHVPIYAIGPNADLVHGVIENTDIFHIAQAPEPSAAAILLALAALAASRRRA